MEIQFIYYVLFALFTYIIHYIYFLQNCRGGHGAHGGGGVGDGSRIFVALFDYDPPTMSPNPEACEEELPFREGQLIKVRSFFNIFFLASR